MSALKLSQGLLIGSGQFILEEPIPFDNCAHSLRANMGVYPQGMDDAIIAAVTMYNRNRLDIPQCGHVYYGATKLNCARATTVKPSANFVVSDYALQAEIIGAYESADSFNVDALATQPFVIMVAGHVLSVGPADGSFVIAASQWLPDDPNGVFFVKATIDPKGKWRDISRVLPSVNSIVVFRGEFTGVGDAPTNQPGIACTINVTVRDTLTFLGRGTAAIASDASTSTAAPAVGGLKSKLRFGRRAAAAPPADAPIIDLTTSAKSSTPTEAEPIPEAVVDGTGTSVPAKRRRGAALAA